MRAILVGTGLLASLALAVSMTLSTAPPPLPTGPSALEHPEHPELPRPLVDVRDLVSIPLGPGPDDIPPIDDPRFTGPSGVDLADTEPVVLLERGDRVRAYPVRVLIWHEIVNDRIGATPVVVTYCPLCNSAVSFRRTVREREVSFGTSGLLHASALVMYDRATESLWTHFDGRAVAGVLAGEQLEPIPSPLVAWGEVRTARPQVEVLDPERTGFRRPYGTNPYRGYDDPRGIPLFYQGPIDHRLPRMSRVVGLTIGQEALAVPLRFLEERRMLQRTMGGVRVLVLWQSGQASALHETTVTEGRDVGTTAVFRSRADGRSLTFQVQGDRFVDRQTSSEWTVLGEATAGPLTGLRLERIPHLDTFWFAWAAHHPDTQVIRAEG